MKNLRLMNQRYYAFHLTNLDLELEMTELCLLSIIS